MGNGSDVYGQFNQSHTSSDHNHQSSYYRNIKPLRIPLMWPQWGTLSGMTVPNTPQLWVPMRDTPKSFPKSEPIFDMPAPVVKNGYQGEMFNCIGTENSLSDMPVTQSQTDTKVHKISPVAVSQHENDTTLTNRNETIPTQVPTCTNRDLDYYKKFDLDRDKTEIDEIDVVSIDANKRPSSV